MAYDIMCMYVYRCKDIVLRCYVWVYVDGA